MSDESNETLIRVKADTTGVDFSIGAGLPRLFYRFLPHRMQLKRGVDLAIAESVIEKIRGNEEFSEAEAAFAEHLFSDQAVKYINLKRIEQRAYQIHEESRLLLEAGEERNDPESKTVEDTEGTEPDTSQDWVNKFREDASLVDSELIREIYARILVEEARHPNSISLRTLAVLRCIDNEVAVKFNRFLAVVLDRVMVPQQEHHDTVFASCGLIYADMMMLDDAGLVNASTTGTYRHTGELGLDVNLYAHKRILRILPAQEGHALPIEWKVHPLTPAGRQLVQIANAEPNQDALLALLGWVRKHTPGSRLAIATVPYPGWQGPMDTLEWESV